MRQRSSVMVLLVVSVCVIEGVKGAEIQAPPANLLQPTGVVAAHDGKLIEPGSRQFVAAIRNIGPATFLIEGHSSSDSNVVPFGTAFLISKQHRLLATAAHVADAALECSTLLAVPNGTSDAYRVERIYYHPCVLREFDVGLFALSTDARDGEVALPTKDVALLKLADGGPELPAACELATLDDLRGIDQKPVGFIGFPLTTKENEPITQVASVKTAGVIDRMIAYSEDHDTNDSAPFEDKQWIRVKVYLGPGASGGPLFLQNGRVIGVASSNFPNSELEAYLDFVRIDAVQMILAQNGFTNNAGAGQGKTAGRVDLKVHPKVDGYRRAVRYVREGTEFHSHGQYRAATERYNEAIRLIPHYAWAYFRRGEIYLHYCATSWASLTVVERRRYAGYASDDATRCIRLLPDANPQSFILQVYANYYIGLIEKDKSVLRRNIEYITWIIDWLKDLLVDAQRAELISCRAHCRETLGDFDGARRDFEELIRLMPGEPRWRLDQSRFRERRNRRDLATQSQVRDNPIQISKP